MQQAPLRTHPCSGRWVGPALIAPDASTPQPRARACLGLAPPGCPAARGGCRCAALAMGPRPCFGRQAADDGGAVAQGLAVQHRHGHLAEVAPLELALGQRAHLHGAVRDLRSVSHCACFRTHAADTWQQAFPHIMACSRTAIRNGCVHTLYCHASKQGHSDAAYPVQHIP